MRLAERWEDCLVLFSGRQLLATLAEVYGWKFAEQCSDLAKQTAFGEGREVVGDRSILRAALHLRSDGCSG